MPRKKRPKPDDPEQSARFIEAAEKLVLVDGPEKALDEAFNKIRAVKKKPLARKSEGKP